MSTYIYKDKEQAAESLAEWIVEDINRALQKKQRYSFVLSGGSTPKALYDILSNKYATSVDWNKVDFFWGDERYVPFDDERNNALMATMHLLTPLKISTENIFIIPTDRSPRSSAVRYEHTLNEYFRNSESAFDLVLLGMGTDGHTLSLFPGSDLIYYRGDDRVKDTVNQKEQLPRITLMPRIVNAAEKVVFFLHGAEKASPLREVLKGGYSPEQFPSQLIKPDKHPALWFIDEAAAQEL